MSVMGSKSKRKSVSLPLSEHPSVTRVKDFGKTVVAPWWREVRNHEMRLFRVFLVVSAVFHLGVIGFQGLSMWQKNQSIIEEWTLDADLIADVESGAPLKSALPDAKEAPEAKVSDRMLPQLTKKFTIDEKTPEEKTFLEKQEVKPGDKPVKEEVKEARTPTLVKDDDEQNRIQKDDALKRLALESLRQQNKIDKEAMAETKGDPKLADATSASAKDINTGATLGIPNRSSFNRYRSLIAAAVKRNYTLPEAYNYKSMNVAVSISLVVSATGSIVSLKIDQSSGDQVFDDLCVQALKASVYPPPPADLVGQALTMRFSPGTM